MWFTLALVLCMHSVCILSLDIETINQWTLLDFEFEDASLVSQYRPENTVFTGLEVTRDRLFLAMPRLRAGVPATLAYIPTNTPPGSSPPLRPYPDWSHHGIGAGNNNCSGLISVYRIRQDSCNRLWVLDSGIMTSLDDFTRICTPKLLIIDISTDTVVRQILFPREVLRPASLFTNIILDESVQGTCDSAVAYISDTVAPGIVIYDSLKDQAWRVMHPTMFPDPDFSDYSIENERFSLMDGIVGLAHSPTLGILYYQPLATDRIFTVATTDLRRGPLPEGEELPVRLAGRKASQGLGLAVDSRDDTLYFSPLAETSIATWNPITSQQRLIAYDTQRLQFPAEIRWTERDPGHIWVLTTRFHRFFKRIIRPNEINLRIIRIPIDVASTYPPLSNSLSFFK